MYDIHMYIYMCVCVCVCNYANLQYDYIPGSKVPLSHLSYFSLSHKKSFQMILEARC